MHYLHKILVYIPDVTSDRIGYEKPSWRMTFAGTQRMRQNPFMSRFSTGGKQPPPVGGNTVIRKMCFCGR